MKGLIVKFEDTVRKVGIADNCVSLIANVTRDNGTYWNIGGLKTPENVHHDWKGGDLKVGDEIEVEFTEFDEASPHDWEKEHRCCCVSESTADADDDPELWKWKLERYYELKKVLEEENIIEKE